MAEQGRSPESRAYRMGRRAEQIDKTRQRIVEAAVRLHTTIGPARTTISTLAEEAGVTRVTVYQHFSDADELFAACTAHWMGRHPPPDPTAWRAPRSLEARARLAISELYAWYGRNGDDLYPINRDAESIPLGARAARAAHEQLRIDAVVGSGRGKVLLRAAVGHALSFWTWHSLVVEHHLREADAIALALKFFETPSNREALKRT